MKKAFFSRANFLGVCFFCIFIVASFLSAYSEEVNSSSGQPINISSDNMEADRPAGTVVFRGNVEARQGEVEIYSDELTVIYTEDDEIKLIVARGNVNIKEVDREGMCDTATFYPGEKKIVMEGDPRILRNGDEVAGERITVYSESDKMDIEGAVAVIHPRANGESGDTSEVKEDQ